MTIDRQRHLPTAATGETPFRRCDTARREAV